MRKLAFILLALNFMLTPMASSIAMTLGFSGEHAHFDQASYGIVEPAQMADAEHAHPHPHPHAHHHAPDPADHDQDQSNDEPREGTPGKHTHGEAHSPVFVLSTLTQIFPPNLASAAASTLPSFPKPDHAYPPFRPPQAV
jgi:hypothetical protein